jgi:hypothetical protein
MKKTISILALVFLAACSSGPSDGDLQKVTEHGMAQLDASLAPLGMKISDVFDIETKVKSKADKGNGQWVVQVDQSLTFKKSSSELPLVMRMQFGEFKKGDKKALPSTQVTLIKGDKGWIETE